MIGTVYLSRDHSGKPGRRSVDRGASADLDGDGTIAQDEREANLTPRYLLAAEEALLAMGHRVIPVSDGWYPDRHKRVNGYAAAVDGPQVYVAAHLNAGLGTYGSVFFDYRSTTGEALADAIGKALHLVAPELSAVRSIPANPEDWTANAYSTIRGVGRPVAVCYEPCFIDNPEHAELLNGEGLRAVGLALANGINSYFASIGG